MSDPNGIPPVHVKLAGKTRQVDLNLVVEIVTLLMLVVILAIYRA